MWTLGGYRAVVRIGEGGDGSVWRGVDLAGGGEVAMKRLAAVAGGGVGASRRAEAEALVRLEHPDLLTLHAVLADEEGLVLVTELAPGGDLGAVLRRRGTLGVDEVVGLLLPVARALAAAHGAGWVHGDVAPGNVLLRGDGTAVLGDLGTARLLGGSPGGVRATPETVDPAVVRGMPPDAAADVFALAALARLLLTGVSVWGVGSPQDLLERAAAGRPTALDPADEWPEALVDLVADVLLGSRAARPDAAAFAGLLAAVCAPAPVAAAARVGPLRASVTVDVPPRATDRIQVAARAEGPSRRPRRAPGRGLPSWGGRQPRRGRRRGSARVQRGTAALAVLVLVAALGWWAVGAVPPAGGSATPATGERRDWLVVVAALADARTTAFERGDPGLLARVYSASSPALEADSRTLLAGRSTVPRHDLVAASAVQVAAGQAVVEVTERLPADGGQPRLRLLRMTLHRGGEGWRIHAVAGPSAGDALTAR